MGKGDGIACFLERGQQNGERELSYGFPVTFASFFQNLVERGALHKAHRVIDDPVLGHAEFVEGDDIRVLKVSGDAGLCYQALDQFGRRLGTVEDDLQGDIPRRFWSVAWMMAPIPPVATTRSR